MKRVLVIIGTCWLLVVIGIYYPNVVRAEECDNPSGLSDTNVISSCISKYNGIVDAISKANTHNAKELAALKAQITGLKVQIIALDARLVQLAKDVFDREVKIGIKNELLSAKIHQDYIRRRQEPVLLMLFASNSANQFLRDLSYRQRLAQADHTLITSITGEVRQLTGQAEQLQDQQENLTNLKSRVDKQAEWLQGEVDKANKYVSDLSGKISALSARQQALLAEKTGTFATSVGDVPLADDPAARPDYNPGFSPAFAAFSFGAPHFKGMSQYGAYGRAKAGQGAEEILRAYYGGGIEIKKDYSTGINIAVSGYGTVDIETYVKRIYEMPGSWGDSGGLEALKAQAVAARSYALAYTDNGRKSICATESCQVYKPANKGGKWEEAVNATRGWVLMTGGKPFSAWYASTSGGYQESYTYNGHTTPGFWDTTSNWTNWASGAWEVKGGSPWFYKGWYRSRAGKTCNRSHPWLTVNEMSDIVNTALVYANGGDASGIFPLDGCLGNVGWNHDRMASEADKFGGRITSIDSVRVEHGSNGVTSRVIFSTNRGELSFAGNSFVKVFNLRAPGVINLKSGLFNIEKK